MNASAGDVCRGVSFCRLGVADLWSAERHVPIKKCLKVRPPRGKIVYGAHVHPSLKAYGDVAMLTDDVLQRDV